MNKGNIGMAKGKQSRPVPYGRDQPGCLWGIISMFDLRHGRLTQNLLSDGSRWGRSACGEGNGKNKGILTSLEKLQKTNDGEGSDVEAADAGKPSVKKLIEQEMINDQDLNKELNSAESEAKESKEECKGHKKKQRKKNRSRSKSCNLTIEDVDVDSMLEQEQPCFLRSEEKSTDMFDMVKIMEEFCHQIHKKSTTCEKYDQHIEVHEQPNERNPDFKETLVKAIRLFMSQKHINANHGMEDENVYFSKEITDVLQNLASDDKLFLQLFQGPESATAKYIQNLWSARGDKDELLKSLSGSNLLEHDLHSSQQLGEVTHGKQRKFFGRKVKSPPRNVSAEENVSEASNQIGILKPGPTSLQNPESEGMFVSVPGSKSIVGNRVGSLFFFTGIKRKLKHAMRKERQEVSTDKALRKSTLNFLPKGSNDKIFKEQVATNSPSKDHFFTEKIAKPTMIVKRVDKESIMESETINSPRQSVPNIYIEAKKHLSQMLSHGVEDVGSPSKQVPKTLGRILSLPDCSNSPVCSPGRDWGQSFVTANMSYSAAQEFQNQDIVGGCLGPIILNSEAQLFVSDKSIDDKAQAASSPESSALDELVHDTDMEKTCNSIGVEVTSQGDAEILKLTEVVLLKETDNLERVFGPSILNNTGADENGDMHRTFEGLPEQLNKGLLMEKKPLSPLTSPSDSSNAQTVEESEETATELIEQPSPVSVLEPLLMKEISLASARSQSVELAVAPLSIQFEDLNHLAADKVIHSKHCTDDKESVFNYVNAVLQASGLNWDDYYYYVQFHSSDQLLDPTLCDEVEFFPNQLCLEKKLLFGCIEEVLSEVFWLYFCCAFRFFSVKHTIQPFPDMKDVAPEVCKGVYWHVLPLPLPHNLDQIINKDISKSETWMDLRYYEETIIVEISAVILEDLLEETILTSTNASF